MRKTNLKNLILSAVFLAIGMVLPFFTSQIKEIGDTLLPMHIPVMLCGLVCGAKWGASVGFVLPFLRSALFSMPPIFPNAVWMAFELLTYGFVIGFVYSKSMQKSIWHIYKSLIVSMISGRIVWAIAKTVLLYGSANPFTLGAFIAGGFIDALPGIMLQLILIPPLVRVINKGKREV